MIIKLPIINNNKVVYTLFKLEKIDNYLLLSILENSNIANDNFFNCSLLSSETNKTVELSDKIKSNNEVSFMKILSCNNINGISYLNIYFPLKLFIIDSNVFCIYFFIINLTSNFKNKLDFFFNLNEILVKKFNLQIINFDNLLKYESNIFEIINNEYKDFIVNKKFNKEFWEMINLLLNLSIFILWINKIKTNDDNLEARVNKLPIDSLDSPINIDTSMKKNKLMKKIYQISNHLKTINYSINYSNEYTVNQHLQKMNNEPLVLIDIVINYNYFLQITEKKIIYIKVLNKNINLIKIDCFTELILFEKYKWYNYPPDTKISINKIYLKLLNNQDVIKIIINKYNSKLDSNIIDNIINYFTNNQYKSNLFNIILENNITKNSIEDKSNLLNFVDPLENNINETIYEKTDIELLKNNSYSDDFFFKICSKYINNISIFEVLFSNYTFPIKYNKKEIDRTFDNILYYSLLNINNIISIKDKDKYIIVNNLNVIIPNKVKLIYFNIIKIFYQFKNNITHNLIYDSILIYFLKIFFSSKSLTLDLLGKHIAVEKLLGFKQNLFTNFIIIDILSRLTWSNINKRLPYLQILYNNKKYLFFHDKLNKNLFLDNYDTRIRSIIINPFEMFKYLRREIDFIKWIHFLENKCSELYFVPISLCSNDFEVLGKMIYYLLNIKEQTFEDKYYKKLLEISINNPKIILNSFRINLKIKENFGYLKCNINLGILSKHLSQNKDNIIKFNDDNNEKSEIELLKKNLEKVTKKYYKYKRKYNSLLN